MSGTCHAVVMEQQVKLEAANGSVFKEIEQAPYILTYKNKPLGRYYYQDYYYDTKDMALARLGYSYRFRIRDKGDGEIEYAVQLKREYGNTQSGSFKREEIDDVLAARIGKRISRGDWSDAFKGDGINTMKVIRKLLSDNNIDPGALAPVIYAEQTRYRYQLTENGKLHFEISLDDCTMQSIKDNKKNLHFYQVEIENKFRKDTPEYDEMRIRDLIDFFTRSYPVSLIMDSKYRSAVSALFGQI